MNICFLTPSDRTNKITPPLIRRQKRLDVDGRFQISVNEYLRLPALEKAGFLLAHEKGFYVKKYLPDGARREAAHRLVEASKSPTSIDDVLEREKSRFNFLFNGKHRHEMLFAENTIEEFAQKKQVTPHNTAGCSTVIQYREWAEEWRVRTQVEATSGSLPPSQTGERISELLSGRGAKKIAESCEFMSLKKGGFKTFVTGTFNEATRKKIKLGETTIQREVSRCMDALQKMYQRGWSKENGEKVEGITPIYKTEKNRKGEDVEKLTNGLSYCWVVEIPVNENYEENPHVHMLLGWSVPYRHFAEWAARIERIWGNGYFHLEKIKDCNCAGAYMAKAAGYMTKAQGDESQGKVRGNRYGISEPARAPDWVTIGKSQLHSMGQIIADVYDHLTVKHGPKYKLRKSLNEQLALVPKTSKWTREQIGKKLEAVRAELKKIPVRCNKYQIILKGQTVAGLFFSWAKGEKVQRPDWLPELPADLAWQEGRMPVAGDSHYFRKLKAKFMALKRMRQAFTNEMCAFFAARCEDFKNEALSMWGEYERTIA